jgi:hypothetical protein
VLRADGGPIPASAEVAVGPAGEGSLLERLDIPRRLHAKHGTRSLVVFDEFQDVLPARGQIDAAIRSVIQHHGDAASYVFSGSHPGMMRSSSPTAGEPSTARLGLLRSTSSLPTTWLGT